MREKSMKEKKPTLRMCIVTREMLPKRELLRIVKTPTNEFVLDFTGKLNGRGAYIKNSLETLQTCKKTKALNRAFKMNLSPEVYDKLLEEFLANNTK